MSRRYVRAEGRAWIISAEAPLGRVWRANGLHEYVAATYYTNPTAADVRREMAECLSMGTEPCTDPDCEWDHGR